MLVFGGRSAVERCLRGQAAKPAEVETCGVGIRAVVDRDDNECVAGGIIGGERVGVPDIEDLRAGTDKLAELTEDVKFFCQRIRSVAAAIQAVTDTAPAGIVTYLPINPGLRPHARNIVMNPSSHC